MFWACLFSKIFEPCLFSNRRLLSREYGIYEFLEAYFRFISIAFWYICTVLVQIYSVYYTPLSRGGKINIGKHTKRAIWIVSREDIFNFLVCKGSEWELLRRLVTKVMSVAPLYQSFLAVASYALVSYLATESLFPWYLTMTEDFESY